MSFCAYSQARVFGATSFWNHCKFSTGHIQASKLGPLQPVALCLLEHPNVYTFVISYLTQQGDLIFRKTNMFFND